MRPRPLAGAAVALMVGMLAAGCTTTPTSRSEAAEVRDMLSAYMENRRAAIDRLNAAARSSYAALMGQYKTITRDRLSIDRMMDARAAADATLLDWKNKTTASAIIATLQFYRDRQVRNIDERTVAIQNVQRRFADSYAELALELGRLKQAVEKLDQLSRTEKLRERLPAFAGQVIKAYQATQNAQDTPSNP